MPSFPKPSVDFNYQTAVEVQRLREYRDTEPGRQIPVKANNRLLIGTWNIANLGQQKRRDKDYRILAEIIGWFDIVAVQETKDDLSGLRAIRDHLPNSWEILVSDKGGNDERMAFLYDANKVAQLEKVGEIAVPPKDHKHIKLPGITRKFNGFDRNPYLCAFVAGSFQFLLVNVHLFYGSAAKADVDRRALEAYAVARWSDLRTKDKDAYVTDIIPLGDFNLPAVKPGDPIYSALRRRGLERPAHSTKIASAIASDSEYDQIMFFPGETDQEFTGNIGVFDFDGGIFQGLWNDPNRTKGEFKAYVRYYISDHRPLWAEFRI
jgi:endonuclease/exonuclease/phosphatase family metal-dependent hydrolase